MFQLKWINDHYPEVIINGKMVKLKCDKIKLHKGAIPTIFSGYLWYMTTSNEPS